MRKSYAKIESMIDFKQKRLSGLIVVLICLPCFVAMPCGEQVPYYRGYTLINPEILGEPIGKPLLFSETYYSFNYWYSFDGEENEMDENIEEWHHYFDGQPSKKDIRELIYEADVKGLQLMNQQTTQLTLQYKLNTLVDFLSKKKHPDFLPYLIYAKQCEPVVSNPYNYNWKTEENELSEIAKNYAQLIKIGETNYAKATDQFIKLRYAFQLVRLAHYFKGNTVHVYDKYVKPLKNVKSIMHNWALAHKAGALVVSKNKEERAEGNYLFSKVLAAGNFKDGKDYRSMNIDSEEMWQAVFNRCQNGEERANLHFIRSLDVYSKGLEEMHQIYKLYPKFKHLEVLLVRELQKLETVILEDKFDGFEQLPEWVNTMSKAAAKDYLKELKPFVNKVAEEQKVNRPELWVAAAGYLEFLDDNYEDGKKILAEAARKINANNLLSDQIEMFQFGLLLSMTDTIEPWIEQKVALLLDNNDAIQNPMEFGYVSRYNNRLDEWTYLREWHYQYQEHNYVFEKMADLYYKQGELAKAYLCLYSIEGLKLYPHSQTAKAILDLMSKKGKSKFEEFLLEKESIQDRSTVIEILGKAYLMEDKILPAYAAFSMIPNSNKDIKNPFGSISKPFDKKVVDMPEYTSIKMIEKVLNLKSLVISNSSEKSLANLQLGNYYYNTSWYGHAWDAKDYFWSVHLQEDLDHPLAYTYSYIYHGARGNRDVGDLDEIMTYFKNALVTTDKELKAEATFMLAKCERARYREENHHAYRYDEKNAPPKTYLQSYRQMESDFGDTDYYKMVIRECADFRAYVN